MIYISYPLGAVDFDDNQAAQRYFMSELSRGNFKVGNVRYNAGYGLAMFPFYSLARALGELGDRALLLFQVAAYSAIPFLVYDMMRRRMNARTALIAAIITLLDPFGLQWAHVHLPGWMIALATVLALWLAQLAWSTSAARRFLLIALASGILGLMVLARLNFAPLVAIYGLSFLLWRHIPLSQRLALLVLVAAISFVILSAFVLKVQLPSTGTGKLSCVSGWNAASIYERRGVSMRASNGPRSREYAELLTLAGHAPDGSYRLTYELWRIPGSWVMAAEREAFLAQPIGEARELINTGYSPALYRHLGPCAADELLLDVVIEAILREPDKFVAYILRSTLNALLQRPTLAGIDYLYLDRESAVYWSGENVLGFQRAESKHYSGHRVWRPGLTLYSRLFHPVNLIKLLTPLALLAALRTCDWLLLTSSACLLAGLLTVAIVANAQPRYFAMLAPLYTVLIGWFIARLLTLARNTRLGAGVAAKLSRN